MTISIIRMQDNLEYVGSTFNTADAGYNRLAFSKEEKEAINWLEEELKKH